MECSGRRTATNVGHIWVLDASPRAQRCNLILRCRLPCDVLFVDGCSNVSVGLHWRPCRAVRPASQYFLVFSGLTGRLHRQLTARMRHVCAICWVRQCPGMHLPRSVVPLECCSSTWVNANVELVYHGVYLRPVPVCFCLRPKEEEFWTGHCWVAYRWDSAVLQATM